MKRDQHFKGKSIVASESIFLKNLLALLAVCFLFSFSASAQQSKPEDLTSPASGSPKIVNNGYFDYVVTGNEEVDAESYKKAKENFVTNQPAEYQKMIESGRATSRKAIDKNEFDKLPKEKQQHILANPDKYQIVALPSK